MNKIVKYIWHNSIGPTYNKLKLKYEVDNYLKRLPSIIERIKKKDRIKVVFFVINEGMWKYDGLFRLLLKDSRFEPVIISFTFPIDSLKYRCEVQNSMRRYFKGKGYPYMDSYDFNTKEWLDINEVGPDVVLYTQPYNAGFQQFTIKSLWDNSIFVYVPYCYQMEMIPSYHNLLLQNICWKMFYPTEFHKGLGERFAYNKGRNIVVTGYSMSDTLISDRRTEWVGWKQNNQNIKRVIWAPHHSIRQDSTLHNSTFLELSDAILQLAKEYEGKVQFAFKPHPRLINQLQLYPTWGAKRTEEYYETWDKMSNTIYVEGEYTNLFKSSDALIHDCSSFMGEYLNTKNPLMFIARHNPSDSMNDFGKACYDQHYVGRTLEDIRSFIDEVVIKGKDPMHEQREEFFNKVLKPPYGKAVAENMYNEMKELLN